MKRFINPKIQIAAELVILISILLAFNTPLLYGRIYEPFIFLPAQTAAGEWWRTLTFPLIHVSPYHLLLDASAFLLLYHSLREIPLPRRWIIISGSAVGSLLVPMAMRSLGSGLCGLSGIAHGLMAVSGLQLIRSTDSSIRKAGWICTAMITTKSLIEAITGHVLFSALHLGPVGTPVASTHLGGVIGGSIAFLLLQQLPLIFGHNARKTGNMPGHLKTTRNKPKGVFP
ncbi:MAG: rhombosortase [Pontiellaceae bacterium]|nr:rhombosortase [Pontiellaceae bacterium]